MKLQSKILTCVMGVFLFFNGYPQQEIIHRVAFKGHKKFTAHFLKQQIQTQKGLPFDSLALSEDLKKLNRYPGIKQCSYNMIETPSEAVNIEFQIEENQTLLPSFTAWHTIENKIAYGFGLSEYNLLGRNMYLHLYYANNIFSSYGLHLDAPVLFSPNWGLKIGFSKNHTLEPLYHGQHKILYEYVLATLFTGINFSPKWNKRFLFRFHYLNEAYRYNSGEQSDLPTYFNIKKGMTEIAIEKDNRSYNQYLTTGSVNTLQFQMITTLGKRNATGEMNFWTISNNFRFYTNILKHGNLCFRSTLSIAKPIQTPFQPFLIDNNTNIRGIGNLVDRTNALLTSNLEFRYSPIQKRNFIIQSNLFLDSAIWKTYGHANEQTKSAVFTGLGLRLIHKSLYNAIFRLDWGHAVHYNTHKQQAIVFGIGQYF